MQSNTMNGEFVFGNFHFFSYFFSLPICSRFPPDVVSFLSPLFLSISFFAASLYLTAEPSMVLHQLSKFNSFMEMRRIATMATLKLHPKTRKPSVNHLFNCVYAVWYLALGRLSNSSTVDCVEIKS